MLVFGTITIELPHGSAPNREIQSESEESDMNDECSRKLSQSDSRKDVKPVGKDREHQVAPMLFKDHYVPHHS